MGPGTDHDAEQQQQGSDTQPDNCSELTTSNGEGNRLHDTKPQSKKSVLNRQFCVKLLINFSRRFLRGFTSGVILYSGVRIVTALLQNPSRKKFLKIWQEMLSKDCARLATFCALYPSIYQLLVEILGVLHKQTGWAFGIAGGVAGLSIAVLDKSRRHTLAFFALSRALGAGLSTLVTRGHLPVVRFGEIGIISVCTSLIAYSMVLKPQYLNQGYYRSLIKWSRNYTDKTLQVIFRDPGPRFLSCQEVGIHEAPCIQHQLVDLLCSLPGFAKIYLPLHITPVILFKRKQLKEKPLYVFKRFLKNMLMSTLYLGTMVFLTKITVCVLHNASQRPPPLPAYIPLTAGATCGLSFLLERYNRRKELALFIIPQVLTIIYNMIKQSKLRTWLGLPHGFTFIFSLSMMCVMHAYEREPDSLSPLINGVLKIFAGPRSSSRHDVVRIDRV